VGDVYQGFMVFGTHITNIFFAWCIDLKAIFGLLGVFGVKCVKAMY